MVLIDRSIRADHDLLPLPIGQNSFMRVESPVAPPVARTQPAASTRVDAEPAPSRFYLNFDRAPQD